MLRPNADRLEKLLSGQWAELAARPQLVATLAILAVQDDLVVPLIEEVQELRGQVLTGLARQLLAQLRAAYEVLPHTHEEMDKCGACVIGRILADVSIRPVLGTE